MMVFTGFKFKKRSTPLHNLDPRVKFLSICVILSGAFLFQNLLPMAIVFVSMIPIVIVGKTMREWLKMLRGASIFAAIIFVMDFLYSYAAAGYVVTGGVIEFPSTMALRITIMIMSFSIFFLSTSPDDFGLALQKTRIPFDICFAFTMAMRFVPVLAAEAKSISDAQRARGLELERGGLIGRVKKYIPILIPLIANSIRRSVELAEAMESRGYGVKTKRTSLYILKLKGSDFLILGFSVLAIFLMVYTKLFVVIPTYLG